jgi:peptide/nickel transport system substrate-binding protein
MLLALPAACLTTGERGCSGDPVALAPCRCPARLPGAAVDGGPESPANTGGQIAIRIGSEPGTLLPMLTPNPVAQAIASHDLFEALVELDDPSGTPLPELAVRWNVEQELGRFVFHLDREARWHDGPPVTADDVEYTFARLLDPAGGAIARGDFLDIKQIEVLDEHTIAFELDRYRPDFVGSLADVPILPAHVFGNDPLAGHPAARAPIGSGPFRFADWQRGAAIELVRNERWRGTPPAVDRVIYRVVPDTRVALDLFRGGRLDVVPDVPLRSGRRLLNGRLISFPLPRFEAWVYNTANPVFADAATRTAFGHLIDREALRCSILDCLVELISGPWPAGEEPPSADHGPQFDPAAAREMLTAAGWVDRDGDGVRERDGEQLAFTLLLPDSGRDLQRAVTVVQHDLDRAGVRMRVSTVSWSAYTERLRKHRFDASVIAFPNRHPFDPWSLFHSAAAASGRNFGRFADPAVDELLERLREATAPEARRALIEQIDEHLRTLQPFTFTFRPRRTLLVRDTIRGVRVRDGWIDERALWVAATPGGPP